MKEIKDLNAKQLAKLVKWEDVRLSMCFFYPSGTGWKKYNTVFKRILTAPTKKQKDPIERLQIYAANSEWKKGDVDSYLSIHSILLGTKEYGDKPKSFSLSFRDWNELINLRFSDDTFEYYRLQDILAVFIYELTWYGNEKDSKKTGETMYKRLKEAIDDHKKNNK